jgi:putative N6-adenine-specific DNA methylase
MARELMDMEQWMAAAAFGLEGLVRDELAALGITGKAEPGGVRFEGGTDAAFLANLWLSTADRVQLVLGEAEAHSFEALFELVRALPWEDYLPRDARFPVTANCARSQLMSPRDCQTITKKAIVERLKQRYRINWFEETGAEYAVHVALHQNRARITLNASGTALNRRGYRTWTGEAPLRETLAAALVQLSPWTGGTPLHDPFCGTGTILIEAAYRIARRAPGLTRAFAMEQWQMTDRAACRRLREEAKAKYNPGLIRGLTGSDINDNALALCKKHIAQAGLQGCITVSRQDIHTMKSLPPNTCIITNPPYGERLGDRRQSEALYQSLSALANNTPGSQLCVLTAHHGFERLFGKRAASRRRLYNGRLECEALVYL